VDFDIQETERFILLTPSGNIEFYKSLEFKRSVELLHPSRNQNLIFNLKEVNAIDSFGFGFLVTENQKAVQIGYEVRFVYASERLKNRLMQIIQILPNQFFDSLEEAKQ
jgi:anti-anti-sigma factor